MTTQLAFSITPKAPLVSEPSIRLYICPVRDKCLRKILTGNERYVCGFEQAGTVNGCKKYKKWKEGES